VFVLPLELLLLLLLLHTIHEPCEFLQGAHHTCASSPQVKVASLCSRSSRNLPSNTSGVGICRKQAQPHVLCHGVVVLFDVCVNIESKVGARSAELFLHVSNLEWMHAYGLTPA
jgi:hypothetical protein